jgi:hypothetical protein
MLSVLFGLSFIRVVAFLDYFGHSSLQMDFSAFYTAGESLNQGLSPYDNYVTQSNPIWDGVDRFTHSRYLYPPLVATIFQPIATLSYYYAKHLWMLISLACLFIALLISYRVVFADAYTTYGFIVQCVVGIFTCLYYPLLSFLERGQIDSITLLLLVIGMSIMINDHRSLWPGVLFAIATLLKLHIVYIVPFLILRKQWMAVAGYITCGILLSVITLALNGSALSMSYIFKDLPRIARYGEGGTETMKVSEQAVQKVLKGVPSGLTFKDGRAYRASDFEFSTNATLVRVKIADAIRAIGYSLRINMSVTNVSAVLFSIFFATVGIWGSVLGLQSQRQDPPSEFGYWLMILIIILLCAPLTWVMNTIWLLPAVILFLYRYLELRSTTERGRARHVLLLCLGTTGLLIAMIPDQKGFQMLWPTVGQWADHKYVVAECLVVTGLFGYWAYECPSDTEKSRNIAINKS